MKKDKAIVSILLVVLILAGWFSAIFSSGVMVDQSYEEKLAEAADYESRGLYQRAVKAYDEALAIKDSKAVRWAQLKDYHARYKEDKRIYTAYLAAANEAVTRYPKSPTLARTLAYLYEKNMDYDSAYKTLNKAVKAGVKDEKVMEKYYKVKYGYDMSWESYDDYRTYSNGYYAVATGDVWSYIKADGTSSKVQTLTFASSAGENGTRVMCGEEGGEFVDADDVILGRIDFVPEDAALYAEGFVALSQGGKYQVYNSMGDAVFGDYTDCGAFCEGELAVEDSSGWHFVDYEGNPIPETQSYSDIVLNFRGMHIFGDVMTAAKGDKYALFNKKGEQIGDFTCDGMDAYHGEAIAFQSGGKWGFVNEKGEVIIEPQYEDAQSFSNGLAAVCVGGKWGFIDTDGTMVIDPQFGDADYFSDQGCCMVLTESGKYQLLKLHVWNRGIGGLLG